MSASKKTIAGGLSGLVAHSALCPVHGVIPKVAMYMGVSSPALAPLYSFHNNVVHGLAHSLEDMGVSHEAAHDYAHMGLDGVGALFAAAGVYVLGRELWKNRSKYVSSSSPLYRSLTHK